MTIPFRLFLPTTCLLMLWMTSQPPACAAALPAIASDPSCNPLTQSCFPSLPVGPPNCAPGNGGATTCGNGPATLGNNSGTNQGASNPINVISGNKYQREDDMPALPGLLGLEIVRHYNSAYSTANTSTGLLGRGWKLSYETDLYRIGKTIQIIQADGSRLIFNHDPADHSLCSTANPANGRLRIDKTRRGDEYIWTWRDGHELRFDANGKLEQILAPTGEFVSLQHDPRGLLIRVTDPQGRELRLQYPDKSPLTENKMFRGVATIDSPVGQYAYHYGSKLPAGSGVSPETVLANLVRVDLPERGLSRQYHHEDALHPTYLTGISVVDARDGQPVTQRIGTYRYNIDGKAILTVRGTPLQDLSEPGNPPERNAEERGIGQVTLDYATPVVTVLTNSLGQTTTFRHGIIAGEFRLREVRGAGCYRCGPTNVRYTYDQLGRLTATTRLDQAGVPLESEETILDARGRPLQNRMVHFVAGKPQPARMQQWFVYPADDSDTSVSIVRPSVIAGKTLTTTFTRNDRGQLLSMTEQGWSPGLAPADAPMTIARITTYRYALVNGRSVLVETRGPSAIGPVAGTDVAPTMRAEWDSKGNAIVAMTTPGSGRSTLTNDAAGRIASVTGEDGHRSVFTYNFRNELMSSSTDGVTQVVQRDAQGYPREIGEQRGTAYTAQVHVGVDVAGRTQWSASPLGILQRSVFDTEGHLLESATQSASFKQTRRFNYDAVGRLVASTDAAGGTSTLRWNANNRVAAMTDALGRERRYDEDNNGYLVQVTEAVNTALARWHTTTTRFGRDAAGRLQTVTAPNGTLTRYATDDFGRTVAVDSTDSGRQTRLYNATSQLVGGTDANGNRASYDYDEAGRLVQRTLIGAGDPAGQPLQTRWTYNGKDLVAIDTPGEAERFTRDTDGRLLRKDVTVSPASGPGTTHSMRYTYDALGQLASSSLPDGSSMTVERNGQQQVVALARQRLRTPWLRWMLPDQPLVSGLSRDLSGLRHVTYGNGIEADYLRSREGVLARIVYRRPGASDPVKPAGLAALFGIGIAQAADAQVPVVSALPGALGLPPDPRAMLDHRYLWDVQGNLLEAHGSDASHAYGYDALDRLVVAGTIPANTAGATSMPVSTTARYFHDNAGNRLLSQENVSDPADTRTGTIRYAQTAGSNRWFGSSSQGKVAYDAAGQPGTIGARRFTWDAAGRLTTVRQSDNLIATYRYNHRGERIAKTVAGQQTRYLYENRLLVAELDAAGRIRRQYLYLANQPMAVIDTPDGAVVDSGERTFAGDLAADLRTLWRALFTNTESLTYLHGNHLGAIELATDTTGNPVWRAAYSAYGKVTPVTLPMPAGGHFDRPPFTLNLRFPGQYADAESGLYYNDHRYYDPQRGQYLTPDPLGLRGDINSYAYVAHNPLKYVDPSGLILFAFDGTSNDESDSTRLSNVVRFRDLYNDGKAYYITGVATEDSPTGIKPAVTDLGARFDIGFAYTGKARIAAMISNLEAYADNIADDTAVNIDIVGFSRGASQGRDFANYLVGKTSNGYYRYNDAAGGTHCQKLNYRFIGLFDTVLSNHSGEYALRIPDAFQYVAHATALNEYRGINIRFPLESILGVPATNDRVRIERSFLGSHSDIGGGFPDQDLAKVAMLWMVNQAKLAGVKINNPDNTIISNPVIHDKSPNLTLGDPAGGPTASSEDRDVIYGDGSVVKQRKATTGLMTYNDTLPFIRYKADPNTFDSIAGTVDAKAYLQWLNDHDYDIPMTISQGKP